MYKIKIIYDSGDSFNKYNGLEQCLEPKWSNIDIAKENLKRIQVHHNWVKNFDPNSSQMRYGYSLTDEQNEVIKRLGYGDERYKYLEKICIKNAPSFVKVGKKFDLHELTYYVNLLDDDRNTVRVTAFWEGYFETLYGASIIADEEDGWSFTL